ncbi:hypothetical protein PtA15_10A700 [Puccinia triticina]|uniref:Uncharacterized protein n=1 Tax=Puccinia triticina TaxID=208348 RepID=A0ABY7CYS6_9BASI|nr:uncharacterized protein PtA15_10A700 [Puccinia triticina]WAQ89276.1 hypothetical protein PtA15_10A700 [Puccinia triticina]
MAYPAAPESTTSVLADTTTAPKPAGTIGTAGTTGTSGTAGTGAILAEKPGALGSPTDPKDKDKDPLGAKKTAAGKESAAATKIKAAGITSKHAHP